MNSGKSWKEERRRQDLHPGLPRQCWPPVRPQHLLPHGRLAGTPQGLGLPTKRQQWAREWLQASRALALSVPSPVLSLPSRLLSDPDFPAPRCSTNKVIFPHFLPLPPPSPRVISFPTPPTNARPRYGAGPPAPSELMTPFDSWLSALFFLIFTRRLSDWRSLFPILAENF